MNNLFNKYKRSARQNPIKNIIFLSLLLIITVITIRLVQNQHDLQQRATGKVADIILTFDTSSTKAGETMMVDVSVDSYNTPIKEVLFNLSYPDGKTVPKVSYDNSIFSIQNEEIIRSGLIRLGRNTDAVAVGKTRIGTIEFLALESIDSSQINQTANSVAIAKDEKTIPLYQKKEILGASENVSFFEKILNQIMKFFGII